MAACNHSQPVAARGAPADSPTPATGTPAADPSSGSAPSPEAAPSPGTTLGSLTGDGRITAIANEQGQGFTIIQSLMELNQPGDESTLQAYDATGQPLGQMSAGSFTGECGAADITNTRGRLVVTVLVTDHPAQGLDPATHDVAMTAMAATTGTTVWTANLVTGSQDPFPCSGTDGRLTSFAATLAGRWGTLLRGSGDTEISDAIDLTSGKLYPRKDLQGTLGNNVVIGTDHTYYNGEPNTTTLTDPESWKHFGTFKTGGADTGVLPLDGPGEYASAGQISDPDDPPGVTVTPDGSELIVVMAGIYIEHSSIEGYDLPSAHRRWHVTSPRYATDRIVGDTAALVLIDRAIQPGHILIALDAHTGKQLWSTNLHDGAVCGNTGSRILVLTGDQLATLDTSNGKQISYEQDPFTKAAGGEPDCPAMLQGVLSGIAVTSDNVLQILTP
jgi:hypothetical protein